MADGVSKSKQLSGEKMEKSLVLLAEVVVLVAMRQTSQKFKENTLQIGQS